MEGVQSVPKAALGRPVLGGGGFKRGRNIECFSSVRPKRLQL